MKKFVDLLINEDARDAGYPHELYTPRPLSKKDYGFVAINENRKIGETVLNYLGEEIVGSKIIENNDLCFQYTHIEKDESERHIESVDMYRNLWNSIHIPLNKVKI